MQRQQVLTSTAQLSDKNKFPEALTFINSHINVLSQSKFPEDSEGVSEDEWHGELGEAGADLKSQVKGDSSGSAKGGSVFARDVVPILRKHKCFNCHSAKESNKVEADLDFSVPSTMRAFLSPNQPGNPATTPLVLAVTAAPGEGRPMPPTGPRMSDAEVDVIKAWIAAGAKY